MKKKIKDLKVEELKEICLKQDGCRECPLYILCVSSCFALHQQYRDEIIETEIDL